MLLEFAEHLQQRAVVPGPVRRRILKQFLYDLGQLLPAGILGQAIVRAQRRFLRRIGDGPAEPADLVDQTKLLGLSPRPDAPLGDLQDLRLVELPRLRHL